MPASLLTLTDRVERVVTSSGAAVVWVSHDPDQPGRVGGRILSLPLGQESVVARSPPLSPDQARDGWAEGDAEAGAAKWERQR